MRTTRTAGTETLKKGLNMAEALEEAKLAESSQSTATAASSKVDSPSRRTKEGDDSKDDEQVVITGAGTDLVNGYYKRKGKKNKISVFINDNGVTLSCEIINGQPGWICGKAPSAFYGIVSDSKVPPPSGWRCYSGASPSPSIAYIPKKNNGDDKNMTLRLNRGEDYGTMTTKSFTSYAPEVPLRTVSSNPSLLDGESARFAIYNELINSEKLYIESISFLVNQFLKPLEDDASVSDFPILSSENIISIFSNLTMLLGLHQQLLSKLESGRDSNRLSQVVPATFIQMQPHFFMYSTYCANLINSWDVLVQQSSTNPKFSQWVASRLKSTGCKKSLAYMIGMYEPFYIPLSFYIPVCFPSSIYIPIIPRYS